MVKRSPSTMGMHRSTKNTVDPLLQVRTLSFPYLLIFTTFSDPPNVQVTNLLVLHLLRPRRFQTYVTLARSRRIRIDYRQVPSLPPLVSHSLSKLNSYAPPKLNSRQSQELRPYPERTQELQKSLILDSIDQFRLQLSSAIL